MLMFFLRYLLYGCISTFLAEIHVTDEIRIYQGNTIQAITSYITGLKQYAGQYQPGNITFDIARQGRRAYLNVNFM